MAVDTDHAAEVRFAVEDGAMGRGDLFPSEARVALRTGHRDA
jgi:hypothetical protein